MGIRNPLTVTRRPGERHFIVESGGNTRLLAIRELWAETGEARFEKICVLFRPWRSESHVLTAHMVENEQRGEMTFWDRATCVMAIKSHLEAEKGAARSLRQLEAALAALDLATNPTSLSHYVFVTERLRTLAESFPELSAQDVKTIQPRLNALKRYAQSRAGIEEAELYGSIWDPAIRQAAERCRRDEGFSAVQLCEACEVALARRFDQPVAELRLDVDASAGRNQGAAIDASKEQVRPTVQPSATAPDVGSVQPNSPAVNAVDSRCLEAGPDALQSDLQPLPPASSRCRKRATIAELVQHLAQRAGILEFLLFDPEAPLGFRSLEQFAVAQDSRFSTVHVRWLPSYLACAQVAWRSAGNDSESGRASALSTPCDLDASTSDPTACGSAVSAFLMEHSHEKRTWFG